MRVLLRTTKVAERHAREILGHGNHRRRKGSWGRLWPSPSFTGPVGARWHPSRPRSTRRAANILRIIRELRRLARRRSGRLLGRSMPVARRRRAGDSRTRRQWSSYRALRVPRSAEWFVTRNAFAYLCREHVLQAGPPAAYAGECRALPGLSQRQYLFVWLLCELLTLKTC